MKKLILSTFVLTAFFQLNAQNKPAAQNIADGYEIKINFKNCKDTMVFLAKYVFDKQYLVDTCKKVSKGNIVFKGKTPLDKGVYFLVSQEKGRYFDFFVNESQKFTLSTDTVDMVKHLKSINSKENEEFFNYIRFISLKNKDFMAIKNQTKGMKSADSAKYVATKSKELSESVTAFEKQFMESHKGTYLYDVINLKVEKDAKESEIPKASNGRPDSVWVYHYYKNHFWDGVNLKDDRIIRTPFFGEKMKKYFNSVIIQNPDSVNKELDMILNQVIPGSDMSKFLFAYFTPAYEQSKVMGFDRVFVHLCKEFICKDKVKGVYEEATIKKICERATILEPLLLGNQAPDLMMIDTIGYKTIGKLGFDTVKTSQGATKLYFDNQELIARTYKTLYNVKTDYLVVVFWDVDCGHCQTEIPKLLDEYHSLKSEGYDLQIYSVYTQHDFDKWRKYIIDKKLDWINVFDGVHVNNIKEKYDIYSTPVIYILDKNKKIKAKRIGYEQVKDIIKAMQKEYQSEKK